jgi:hypothetical protein
MRTKLQLLRGEKQAGFDRRDEVWSGIERARTELEAAMEDFDRQAAAWRPVESFRSASA